MDEALARGLYKEMLFNLLVDETMEVIRNVPHQYNIDDYYADMELKIKQRFFDLLINETEMKITGLQEV